MGQAKQRKARLGDLYGKVVNVNYDKLFFKSKTGWDNPVDPDTWRRSGEDDDGLGIYRVAYNKTTKSLSLLRKYEDGQPAIAPEEESEHRSLRQQYVSPASRFSHTG